MEIFLPDVVGFAPVLGSAGGKITRCLVHVVVVVTLNERSQVK